MEKIHNSGYKQNQTMVIDWVKRFDKSNSNLKRSKSFRASEVEFDCKDYK